MSYFREVFAISELVERKIESLYIHFPYCRHLCNYCDFFKSKIDPNSHRYDQFEKDLLESLAVHQKLLDQNSTAFAPLKTLYLGGGTPSLWGKEGAFRLKEILSDHNISFSEGIEFTLEVNPGSWTREGIKAWRDLGVNRFSLGIQSFNEKYIKLLDRVHDLQEVKETLEFFNSEELNFSSDFMLGLPESENDRDIITELEEILSFKPAHLSLYILTVGKGYKHYSSLPSEEYIANEYERVAEFMKERGYIHYEVSNYALPGFESKHNKQYWKQESVAALGPSATGFISYDSNYGVRYKWKTSENNFVIEELNTDAMAMERLFLSLRTSEGLEIKSVLSDKEVNEIMPSINRWISDELCEFDGNVLTFTSKGFLVQDSLIDEIFQVNSGT